MPRILIDADGCPVKDEVYKVAKRYNFNVIVVANSRMHVPDAPNIIFELVGDGFDEADDWIVDHSEPHDIVITADIPLAARALEKDAFALGLKGREFTPESIGDALASREISAHMREHNMQTGGPAPFQQKDRSRFLAKLDELVNRSLRLSKI